MNIEFSRLNGAPIKPEEAREFNERMRRIAIVGREIWKDPELEKNISQIRFDVLKEIFLEYAKKSGVGGDKLNFLTNEDIFAFSLEGRSDTRVSYYISTGNYIGMRLDQDRVRYFDEKTPGFSKIELLHNLCHEETHAVSKNECMLLDSYEAFLDRLGGLSKLKNGKERARSGYKSTQGDNSILFDFFNEGVVEKLSNEVFEKYLERDVDYMSKKNILAYKKELDGVSKESISTYAPRVVLVDIIVRNISQETGVDEKTVWGGLVRGLFEGEKFNDPELQKGFAETFSGDFLKKLSQCETQNDFNDLVQEIVLKLDPGYNFRLTEWYQKNFKQ